MSSSLLSDLLFASSTKKGWPVEYGPHDPQFLSNHVTGGLIALQKLEAPEVFLSAFAECYCQIVLGNCRHQVHTDAKRRKTTADVKSLDIATAPNEEDAWKRVEELRGQVSNFDELREFFLNEIESSKHIPAVLGRYFPALVHYGAALHCLINVGFALALEEGPVKDLLVAEGLAYFVYREIPTQVKERLRLADNVFPSEDLASRHHFAEVPFSIEVLVQILKSRLPDEKRIVIKDYVFKYIRRTYEDDLTLLKLPRDVARFQKAMTVVMEHPQLSALSEAIARDILSASRIGAETPFAELKRFLLLLPLVFYVWDGTNEFFVLHGATAAYAFVKVLEAFSESEQSKLDKTERDKLIQGFVKILVAMHIERWRDATNTPTRPQLAELPTREGVEQQVRQARDKLFQSPGARRDTCNNILYQPFDNVPEKRDKYQAWVEQFHNENTVFPKDYTLFDEHVYKLVVVVEELLDTDIPFTADELWAVGRSLNVVFEDMNNLDRKPLSVVQRELQESAAL